MYPVGRSDRERSPETIKVDVRGTPVWERHPRIFAAFDALASGEALLLVTDHEPRPLRMEFDATGRTNIAWDLRRIDARHWEATIRKLPPTSDDPVERLKHAAVFAHAAEHERMELAAHVRVAALRRGRAVVEQGIVWPYIGVVASGAVQATLIAPDGRELALYEVLPGDPFGTIVLADGGPSALRFVARDEHTVAILVPVESVRAVMVTNSAVAGALHADSARRSREIVERFAAYVAQPVTARLAEALLAYAPPKRGLVEALDPLPHLRQVELAALVGSAKDVVYRSIGELESLGALQRENGRIARVDREKLDAIAQTTKYL